MQSANTISIYGNLLSPLVSLFHSVTDVHLLFRFGPMVLSYNMHLHRWAGR